jgi:hypothetical protein
VSKFADHVPLYRLCQIYGRDGVQMSRSTITDMVGNCGLLLTLLAEAVGRYVLKADKVHGDDTPIRALGGKGEKAHTARLWVYVRDDRPAATSAAGGVVPILGRPQGRAPGAAPVELPAASADAYSGTTRSTKRVGSLKPDAGAMRAESCGTSTSSRSACPGRWRTRAWCGSASCSRSRQK